MNIEAQQRLIQEKLDELPSSLRDAIDSSDWEIKIFDIGRRHKLHIDDLAFLQIELALAIVGISDQSSFTREVQSKLGIDDETMDKIVEDVNNEIFSHIRDHLKEEVFEDEAEKYSESGLPSEEEKEMKKAGISFGVEDAEEDAVLEEETADTDEVEEVENKIEVKVSKPVDLGTASTSQNPAPSAGVFKTKISQVSAEGKPNNFFDPYREPLE